LSVSLGRGNKSFAIFRSRPIRRGRKIKDRRRWEIYIIFLSQIPKNLQPYNDDEFEEKRKEKKGRENKV